MREYDRIAEWYTAARNPAVGAADVAAFAQTLAPGATVLDVGCGDGVPVSSVLARHEFGLVGLDSSAEMLARYRAGFPGVATRHERVQDARFAPGAFGGVAAWGVLFHLDQADQEAVIGLVARWLAPGGRFLFTSGDVAGVREAEMDGVAFRYVSLGEGAYRHLLERAGMRLEAAYRDAWDNCVYVAGKDASGGDARAGCASPKGAQQRERFGWRGEATVQARARTGGGAHRS